MIAPVLMSSKRDDWRTPECVLELVRKLGPIALDPCTWPGNPTGATEFFTADEDGLGRSWETVPPGLVFVNPPYGRAIVRWINKCAAEAGEGAEIVALVPARPDTRWWKMVTYTASAVCFWRGRMVFQGAEHAAPFPSAIIYWGRNVERFRETFRHHGWTVGGWRL